MATLKNTTIQGDTNADNIVKIATGTTAQRPSSPESGMIRFNTTTSSLEFYDGTGWRSWTGYTQASAAGATYSYTLNDGTHLWQVHVYQGTGSLTVSEPGEVEYLLVAGGGGGGAWVGGGGGGGGVLQGTVDVVPQTYPFACGGGGTREYNPGSYGGMPRGTNGGNTTGFGLTAIGGGRGGSWSPYNAQPGGSGGGEGFSDPIRAGTPGQGFPGGSGRGASTNGYPTGGGGGAGGPGESWTSSKSGDGGIGKPSSITGKLRHYGGGGGGGIHGASSNAQPGRGGLGGGGHGDAPSANNSIGTTDGAPGGSAMYYDQEPPRGRDGAAYSGGGGGGSGRSGGRPSYGGNGGSGVVAVRYKKPLDTAEERTLTPIVYQEGLVAHIDFGDDNSYKFGNDYGGAQNNTSMSSFPSATPAYTVKDLSGKNNHLTMSGNSTNSSVAPYTYDRGGSLIFNGSSVYGTIPYNGDTMDFSHAQSICMWLLPTNTNTRRNPYNQAYGGSGTWTHEPGDNINWYFGTSGGNAQPYVGRGSPFSVVDNELAFVVGTRDQFTDQCRWYKNGQLIGTYDAGGYVTTTNSTASITIGEGYVSPYQGYILQLLLYNIQLSPVAIKQIYEATRGRYHV